MRIIIFMLIILIWKVNKKIAVFRFKSDKQLLSGYLKNRIAGQSPRMRGFMKKILHFYVLATNEKLFNISFILEPIPKPLSTATGCKVRGSALSAKKVLDVLQYASEPFQPPALTTNFSLDLDIKQVLG